MFICRPRFLLGMDAVSGLCLSVLLGCTRLLRFGSWTLYYEGLGWERMQKEDACRQRGLVCLEDGDHVWRERFPGAYVYACETMWNGNGIEEC